MDALLGDPEILELVRRRDPGALGRVYDAAFPFVYGLACRILGDRVGAEDVAQEVFLKVHRAADRLDPARHLKPWLTAITRNACRDRFRRRSRRSESSVDPGVMNGIGHNGERPEYVLARKERQRALERGLEALSDEHREIVALRVFAGSSHEEVAEILGISPAAARKRYSRALEKLRTLVGRNEP